MVKQLKEGYWVPLNNIIVPAGTFIVVSGMKIDNSSLNDLYLEVKKYVNPNPLEDWVDAILGVEDYKQYF